MRVEDGEEAHGPQILPGGQQVLFTLATGTAERQMGSRRASSCSRLRREIGRPSSTAEAMRAISRRVISSTR